MKWMLPPLARIAVAALWAAAAFLAHQDAMSIGAYAGALLFVLAAACGREHGRFVLLVGGPLLIALLFTWAYVMPRTHAADIPDTVTGIRHAGLLWLRILTLAALCQWFLLPLVREPLRLRAFVTSLGLPVSVGVLLAMPVLVLPEVQRQIRQVIDARRAQRMPTGGIRGVVALPAMIVPVLAALIETSLNRAELWEHRGLLGRRQAVEEARWAPWWAAWPPMMLPAALIAWEMRS